MLPLLKFIHSNLLLGCLEVSRLDSRLDSKAICQFNSFIILFDEVEMAMLIRTTHANGL
jgi:hypothetical protein